MKRISSHEPIPMNGSEKLCADKTQDPPWARHGRARSALTKANTSSQEHGPSGEERTCPPSHFLERWLPWPTHRSQQYADMKLQCTLTKWCLMHYLLIFL